MFITDIPFDIGIWIRVAFNLFLISFLVFVFDDDDDDIISMEIGSRLE